MRKTLIGIAAVLLTAGPALADPAESGAVAYCASRATGKSQREASDAAYIAVKMQIGLASTLVNAGQLRNRMNYLIAKECPLYAAP